MSGVIPHPPSSWRMLAVLLLAVLLAVVGCGSKEEEGQLPPEDEAKRRLTVIGQQYIEWARTLPREREPDAEAFKEHLKRLPKDALGGVSGDQVLVSPRDKQPFVINSLKKNQLPLTGPPPMPPALMAYEQKGQGGKRYVLLVGSEPQEMEEAAAKQLGAR